METDDLIAHLVSDMRPVRRLPSPRSRAAIVLAAALVGVLIGLMSFGIRHDMLEASRSAAFLVRVALMAATLWLAILTCLRLSVPGGESGAWARWWPVVGIGTVLAAGAGDVVYALLLGDVGPPFRSWGCLGKVATAATIPAIVAVVMIRRGAALEPGWTTMLGLLAAGVVGSLTSELACPIDEPVHILSWHLVPALVAALVGLGAGARWGGAAQRR